jgi:hypothetical protein
MKPSPKGCRTFINTAKKRIDRIVTQLVRETGADDVSIFCFRQNGGFNCSISVTFGTPQFGPEPGNGAIASVRRFKR